MDIKNKKGFTLIELLVVIAIIGILASVTLVSLSSSRTRAKDAKVLSTMNSISKAVAICVLGGQTITMPVSGQNPGSAICSDGTGSLPDLSSTSFHYCGSPTCGGWVSSAGDFYAFSVHNGEKAIVCGYNYNAQDWFTNYTGGNYQKFNFTGTSGCGTYGF